MKTVSSTEVWERMYERNVPEGSQLLLDANIVFPKMYRMQENADGALEIFAYSEAHISSQQACDHMAFIQKMFENGARIPPGVYGEVYHSLHNTPHMCKLREMNQLLYDRKVKVERVPSGVRAAVVTVVDLVAERGADNPDIPGEPLSEPDRELLENAAYLSLDTPVVVFTADRKLRWSVKHFRRTAAKNLEGAVKNLLMQHQMRAPQAKLFNRSRLTVY